MSSVAEVTSAVDLVAADEVQPTNPELSLAQMAKKAGADAWKGLKVALQLVEKSSDVFPPLKSAVAGFLGVVDIFEASDVSHVVQPCMGLILLRV